MSWFFAISKPDTDIRRPDPPCHAPPVWTISTGKLFLAVGGSPDTSFWESDAQHSSGWVVVGIGLTRENSSFSILSKDGWRRLLTHESFDASSLDGHFAALRWNADRVECFTDQLGLRTLYFSRCAAGMCISTRLDWVARTADRREIDFAALGGRWLLSNQLSYESCVAGVDRLGPGGRATFRNGSPARAVPYEAWLPSFEPGTAAAVERHLNDLVRCPSNHGCKVSLGLSGGLDSRLLLAMLSEQPGGNVETHSFGDPEDPDVRIARRIAAALNIPHHRFDDPLGDAQSCAAQLQAFAAQSLLTEPCSSFMKLRYYAKLRQRAGIMIDGGFGEIVRRQYLKRLVRFGKRALAMRDYPRLLRLMRSHRPEIFSADVRIVLERGARRSLEKTLDEMPPPESVGIENFADLLAVRTRVPNYGGPEQARIDNEIMNFIPLVQPSFLRAAFGLPAKLRSDGGLHYDIIRRMNPVLSGFPLVKSGMTYRFGQSSAASWLTVALKSKLTKGHAGAGAGRLFARLQEYILDTAHSSEFKTNPAYDTRLVSDAVTGYYRGRVRMRNTVDWWLTFELWKRSLPS